MSRAHVARGEPHAVLHARLAVGIVGAAAGLSVQQPAAHVGEHGLVGVLVDQLVQAAAAAAVAQALPFRLRHLAHALGAPERGRFVGHRGFLCGPCSPWRRFRHGRARFASPLPLRERGERASRVRGHAVETGPLSPAIRASPWGVLTAPASWPLTAIGLHWRIPAPHRLKSAVSAEIARPCPAMPSTSEQPCATFFRPIGSPNSRSCCSASTPASIPACSAASPACAIPMSGFPPSWTASTSPAGGAASTSWSRKAPPWAPPAPS